jgi:hypothetical protein
MLKRMLIPRSVRRATHPVRTVKRAVTPKPIKQVRRALNPVSNAKYSFERSLNTKSRKRKPTYTHAGCAVKHRTADAAAKCTTGRVAPLRAPRATAAPRKAHAGVSPSRPQRATPPPGPSTASWRFRASTLEAIAGTGRPVKLTWVDSGGSSEQAVVEVLSVDGWTVIARNRARHRVVEFDLRTVQRID